MKHNRFGKLWVLLLVSLILALAIGLATSGASAEGGTWDDGMSWEISNGKLTISGNGPMMDFLTWNAPGYYFVQPWLGRDDITSLEIGSGVTYIGLNAFRELKGLTSVTIPATVTGIGFAAFADCSSLTEVTIDAAMIGESAFCRCYGLKNVNIGPHVTDIGISAFEDCFGLERVSITDLTAWCNIEFGGILANPLEKAKHLYLNGSEVTNLVVPDGVKKINNYAFMYGAFSSVTLPEGLEEIGEYAFFGCMNMKTLSLPSYSLKRIGGYAFESCNGLVGFSTFPESIEYFGAYCFRFIPLAEFLTIPSGFIGRGAFQGCGTVGVLTLGENVTYVSEDAFLGLPLRQVYYTGSQTQWDALTIESGNDALTKAPLDCLGDSTRTPGKYTGKKEVKFGQYAGAEVAWLVLEKHEDKTLLVSKRILEFVTYDYRSEDKAWDKSDIRAWLNGTFLASFTPEQQEVILTSLVPSSTNSRYGTSGGDDTNDKVFLLSEQEVRKYFPYEETAAAKATAGAYARSVKDPAISDPNGNNSFGNTSYWWLRTRGMYNYQAEYVDYLGYVHREGMTQNNAICGVRPAMWVKTSAIFPKYGDVNGDDVIDGRDVIRLMKYLSGEVDEETGEPVEINEITADFNQDGVVDELDLLKLMKYLGGEEGLD